MADIAKYRQEIEKFNTSYAKAAVKEPVNFWGLAGFAVAAAYTGSVIPLLIALIFEAVFLMVVPLLPAYRQLVNKRERQRLLAASVAGREKLIKSFTPREREVAVYIAAGHSNREIAAELYVSERTVETHVANILRKLGLPSRAGIATWATRHDLAPHHVGTDRP